MTGSARPAVPRNSCPPAPMSASSPSAAAAIGSWSSGPRSSTAMPSASLQPEEISEFGAELHSALRARRTVPPLSGRGLDLGLDDAYAISLDFLARRLEEGERVVGK